MRRAPLVAFVLVVGCGSHRLTAPLRYVDAEPPRVTVGADDWRATPPPVAAASAAPTCPVTKSAVLSNGMSVLVQERHDLPLVTAGMTFDTGLAAWDEVGAELVEMMGATFISPEWQDPGMGASCGRVGCSVASQSGSSELPRMLGAMADAVFRAPASWEDYEKRLRVARTELRLSRSMVEQTIERNALAAAFGSDPGAASAWPTSGRLEDLGVLRAAFLRPERATLVIVGDVLTARVIDLATQVFGGWRASAAPALPNVAGPPAGREGPGVVRVDDGVLPRPAGFVVARGPSRADEQAAAAIVTTQILGGGMTSQAFQAVREQMGAAYLVGGRVEWLRRTSLLQIGGLLDPSRGREALTAIVQSIRQLRTAGPAAEELERAKTALVAETRVQAASDRSEARLIAFSALAGGSADACEWTRRIRAVRADDVQRAAATYLADRHLHVILVGWRTPPDLMALGLGEEEVRDGFGRLLESAGSR